MTIVEGYSEHVMDAVIADLDEPFGELRDRMERGREQRGLIEALLSRLLGLDLKLRQYRLGKSFCDEVAERRGIETLNRVWSEPATLPRPRSWSSRGAGCAGRLARVSLPPRSSSRWSVCLTDATQQMTIASRPRTSFDAPRGSPRPSGRRGQQGDRTFPSMFRHRCHVRPMSKPPVDRQADSRSEEGASNAASWRSEREPPGSERVPSDARRQERQTPARWDPKRSDHLLIKPGSTQLASPL